MPAQSLILKEVNSTFVTLALDSWQNGGCAISSYDIEYQVMADFVWHIVQKGIQPNIVSKIFA